MKNKEALAKTAEKIVIDYANLSGRETAHRAEFRELVLKHLSSLLEEKDKEWKKKLKGIIPNEIEENETITFGPIDKKYCIAIDSESFNTCRQQVQENINKLLEGK